MNTLLPPVDQEPPPADPARLFIALWPTAELAAALCARYDAARGSAAARPEALARVHLTLHFLGQVPRARLPALQDALCVPFDPFELCFMTCERWPGGLVVARPDAVPPELAALHAALTQMLDALGLRTESRAFRPHVTLARRDTGPWPAMPQATAPALHWPVRHYVLAESRPGDVGDYRLLNTCSARPAAARPGDGAKSRVQNNARVHDPDGA